MLQTILRHNQILKRTRPTRIQSFSTDNNTQLLNKLTNELGYKETVAKGMLEAIAQSQNKKVSSLTLSSLDMFETNGLEALANSVQNELQSNTTSFKGTIHFRIPHHNNTSFSLEMNEGQSLMELVKDTAMGRELLGEYIECACGGTMSCSTCHVYIDEAFYNKMDPPCEAELDMLDLAYEPRDTSRLGCQVVMKPELDGLVVTIPSGANNFWK